MNRQAGVAAVNVVAGIAVLAVAGAAFFAWQKTSEADRLRSELTIARRDLDKARGDVKKAAQDVAAAAKEVKDLKVAAERLVAERDAVRTSLETAQAAGDQMRGELALAKDQVSYLSARSPKEVVRGMPKAPAPAAKR
jgi:chromosome segregation ATPase